MMQDSNSRIPLVCPLCGNNMFAVLDKINGELVDASGTVRLQCSDCKSIYTKDEIIESNAEKIDIAANELVKDIINEYNKEFKKVLRKWK